METVTTPSCRECTVASCAIETLTEDELRAIQNERHKTSFKKGEIIQKQGAPLDSVIYLRKGYVKEYMCYDTVADQVVQLIKPRSYIGLQGLYTNTTSVFSYQATTDTEVCFIEKTIFSDIIRTNGNFAREILIALSQESIRNHKRFLSLNQTQSFGKVAGLIIYLAEEVYGKDTFELQLKRAELGQMIASTRESVTRALKWFQNEGIITLEKNRIKIDQMERLADIAKRG
jgi:CRP-like cAMP-binding protein